MAKGRIIEGLGIVFNKESNDLGGFREVIAPQAVGEGGKILKESDIWFLINHQRDRILARSNQGKGSLQLKVTPEGVRYSLDVPQSPSGQELASNAERGELGGSSFAFKVAPKGETWLRRKDDYLRTVTAFDYIFDVSAVFDPAYPQTSCELREGTLERTEQQEQRSGRRMTDSEWIEGHARARIAGEPGPEEFKMANVLRLFDDKIKEGDHVTGDELGLLVRMMEERGVKIPERRYDALTTKQQAAFHTSYYTRAKDLVPEIKKPYKMTAEEQALNDEWEQYKREHPIK